MAQHCLPIIDIDGIPSINRYFKKSQIHLQIKQDRYVFIKKGKITLKIKMNDNETISITKENKNNDEFSREYEFTIYNLSKQYHLLYWYLFKMIKKLRKKITKFTIIRQRENNNKSCDQNIICLISLSESYTIHFKNGTMAYLKSINCKTLKFIDHKNKIKKNIPFDYTKKTEKHNDAYDKLRIIVYEFIDVKESIQKQKIKQLDYSKTWKIKWNVDSGSVEDIKDIIDQNKNSSNNDYCYDEGLFKSNYQSESSLSSDFSDTNSEIPYNKIGQDLLEPNNKSLSTVHGSISSIHSIQSEASWRGKHK